MNIPPSAYERMKTKCFEEFYENATLQIVELAVIWDKIRSGEETYLNGTNTCHKFTVTTVLSSMAQDKNQPKMNAAAYP